MSFRRKVFFGLWWVLLGWTENLDHSGALCTDRWRKGTVLYSAPHFLKQQMTGYNYNFHASFQIIFKNTPSPFSRHSLLSWLLSGILQGTARRVLPTPHLPPEARPLGHCHYSTSRRRLAVQLSTDLPSASLLLTFSSPEGVSSSFVLGVRLDRTDPVASWGPAFPGPLYVLFFSLILNSLRFLPNNVSATALNWYKSCNFDRTHSWFLFVKPFDSQPESFNEAFI